MVSVIKLKEVSKSRHLYNVELIYKPFLSWIAVWWITIVTSLTTKLGELVYWFNMSVCLSDICYFVIPCVCCVVPTFLDGIFPFYMAQMIASMWRQVAGNGFWLQVYIFKVIQRGFVIKLLKFGTYFCIRSRAHTVLNGFVPYLAKMISSLRGYVLCNNSLPWHMPSLWFGHDGATQMA